jgi:hypothetical protein
VGGIIEGMIGRGVLIVLPINGYPSDSLANVPVAIFRRPVEGTKKPPIPIWCVVLLII